MEPLLDQGRPREASWTKRNPGAPWTKRNHGAPLEARETLELPKVQGRRPWSPSQTNGDLWIPFMIKGNPGPPLAKEAHGVLQGLRPWSLSCIEGDIEALWTKGAPWNPSNQGRPRRTSWIEKDHHGEPLGPRATMMFPLELLLNPAIPRSPLGPEETLDPLEGPGPPQG